MEQDPTETTGTDVSPVWPAPAVPSAPTVKKTERPHLTH